MTSYRCGIAERPAQIHRLRALSERRNSTQSTPPLPQSTDRAIHNPQFGIFRAMPVGTAFHPRTFALCESLNYREWSGYYTVSAYEAHHEHEFAAIRNGAALIDVSPLFKYLITRARCDAAGRSHCHARRDEVAVGQVIYTPVVRRARQGDRRRHGVAAAGAGVALDRRGSEPALVPSERARARRLGRGHLRAGGRAGRAGADVGAAAAPGGRAPTSTR